MEPTLSVTAWFESLVARWQRFWFTPSAPHTLSLIRILAGAMILYTHLVWSKNLTAFLGPHAWVNVEAARRLNSPFAWSHLYYVESPALLWTLHIAALIVFAMFAVGLFTRVTAILTALLTISYCHRLVGTQFGLDQVNAMLALYLAVGPCGAAYSVDRFLANRQAGKELPVPRSVSANIAVRLIQLHMCVIYLFGGISKMRGDMWWDGSAVWMAIANYEYQSIDMTWLVHMPWLIALMSHVTVFWETFYCVLIWPRWTRPIMLGLAVAVHGGIALFLGMMTFGLAMLIGNLAFVPPEITERLIARMKAVAPRQGSEKPAASKPEPLHHPVG